MIQCEASVAINGLYYNLMIWNEAIISLINENKLEIWLRNDEYSCNSNDNRYIQWQ